MTKKWHKWAQMDLLTPYQAGLLAVLTWFYGQKWQFLPKKGQNRPKQAQMTPFWTSSSIFS
jgi:hypothetical protein